MFVCECVCASVVLCICIFSYCRGHTQQHCNNQHYDKQSYLKQQPESSFWDDWSEGRTDIEGRKMDGYDTRGLSRAQNLHYTLLNNIS